MVDEILAISPWKDDFPIFKNVTMNKKLLVYLDTGASAQKPKAVIDAIVHNLEYDYANVHRGIYSLSEEETCLFEAARDKVKQFINAKKQEEIVFTKGATEAFNLLVQTFARNLLKPQDEVLLTQAEHHANIVPWHILQQEIPFVIKFIPVDDMGNLDMDAYSGMLSEKVKIVSVTGMSNVLGTIMPVKEIASLAHQYGANVIIDASQAITNNKLDVQDIDCEFLAFSGHKLYGPTAVGVLYGKENLLNEMPVWQGGGDMVASVSYETSLYQPAPVRFEAGTPPFVQAIGLGAAIDYLNNINVEKAFAFKEKVFKYLYEQVKNIDGVRILGNANDKGGLVSFVIDGANNQDVGMILNQQGIAVRVGHHCAQPIVERMGVKSAIRASLGIYNGTQDVDYLIKGIEKAKSMLL